MRVAFFTHYTELYGANRSLLGLIDGLKPLGVEFHVFMPCEGMLINELNLRSVPFSVVPFCSWVGEPFDCRHPVTAIRIFKNLLCRIKVNIRSVRAIVGLIRKLKVDIVHTNSAVIPIGALVAHAAGIPHIWHLREFCDLDYGVVFDFGKRLSISFIQRSEALIAVSKAIEAHYKNNELNTIKTHLIYNGILTEKEFDIQRSLSVRRNASGECVFALVGLIHPAKGHYLAIEAIAQLHKEFPRIRLLIVGDGDASDLKRQVLELGVRDHVEFRGFVADPFVIYREADAVLMCSRTEAMGRVTVEAMAACRPVIAHASGGTVELVDDGYTGLLFSGGSQALVESMGKLIRDPELRFRLTDNAWAHARNNFTIEIYAEKVFRVYNAVAGGG